MKLTFFENFYKNFINVNFLHKRKLKIHVDDRT